MCNIPAISGIDVYPLGNLGFIPLLVMAYGILKYRMLDIRRMMQNALAWVVVSSLILMPNLGIFLGVRNMMRSWPDGWLFAVLAGWFGLNLLYFTKAQPLINRAFNQSHANRFQNRTAFLEEIAFLKNLEELSAALTRALSNGLGLSHADLYISPSVAQRILEAVRAYRPEGDLAGRMEGITVSIARASCPADNDQADNLIKTAERLLYKAKASGKNHIAAVEHQRCLQAV